MTTCEKNSLPISLDIDHLQDEWETGKNVCVCVCLKGAGNLKHKADFLLPSPPDGLSI